jgi:hypothetical protein
VPHHLVAPMPLWASGRADLRDHEVWLFRLHDLSSVDYRTLRVRDFAQDRAHGRPDRSHFALLDPRAPWAKS